MVFVGRNIKKNRWLSFGGEVGIHDLEVFQKCFFMPGCSCSLLSYFTFFEADGFFFFKTHLHRWVETPGDVKKNMLHGSLWPAAHVHPDWGFFSVCLPVETRDTNWVFETWAQFPGASRFLLFGFSVEWRWTIQDDSHGPMDDLFRFFGG